jgi:protein tyrosine/serine phosphatase
LAAWLIVVMVGVGVAGAVVWRWEEWAWDHFDVVKPGVLYRSGQLTGAQLEAAVGRFGIKTIVNFLRSGAEVERERELARRLGVDFLHLPMPGDGFGREEQFRAALEAVDDPERRPVLVHCARGTCRTGAAVALYRYERDGWTVEDVASEMRRQTYRQGWLAGYVYQMVKDRPFAELYEPQAVLDRNRIRAESQDGE